MYGSEDPSIAGMVLDSPFSDLVDLMMELAETKVRIPKFTVSNISSCVIITLVNMINTIICHNPNTKWLPPRRV